MKETINEEAFNGMIADQSPEMYNDVLKLIRVARSLRDEGYDLCLAFDDDVEEVVCFWECVAEEMRKVSGIITLMAQAEDIRTVGDLIEDYARVIVILTWPLKADAEYRLNKIFRKDQ